ncbi:MAG: hypothetical protein RIS94_1827 [Pseudomonadota bacterium]
MAQRERGWNGGGWPGAARILPALSLHAVVWWALATLNAVLAAMLVWALVTPVAPLGAWAPAGVRVVPQPMRAALFAGVDPFNRTASSGAATPGGGAVTSLALTLFATRSAPGGAGSAIVAGADGVQQVYRLGEAISPGVKLVAVGFDHVEIERNGAREVLYIDQSSAAPSAEGMLAAAGRGSSSTAPGSADPEVLTAASVRQGIGFGPHAEGGRVVGLEVMPQGDGGVFRAAGFEPGDVITTVGGQPIRSSADAALLAGALRPGSAVSVIVRRGGRLLPLSIALAP